MLLQEAIRARRSVRRYAKRPISLEQLLSLVDCGRQAPTAGNLQAWEFILAQDPETVGTLAGLAPGISAGAEAIVAICIDREKCLRKAGRGGELFGLMDACFAAENLLLAATDAGLGACVVRSFHQDAVRRSLAAPDHVVPELLVTLGHPEGLLPRGPRRRGVEEIVHLGRWGCRTAKTGATPAGVAGPEDGAGTVSEDGAGTVSAPVAAEAKIGAAQTPETLPLRAALRQHLGYLAASAHGLLTEPQSYGPYRLADSASRLISVMEQHGLADQTLLEARRLIEDGKLDVVVDVDRFSRMVDEVLRRLAE
jgi:nitroreductase